MASVQDHYDKQLGSVYTWMVGGVDSAIERGTADIEGPGLSPVTGGYAVDLGAGFGMHAIPLARRGFRVLAIDSCAVLLDELRARKASLPIEAIEDDLRSYREHLTATPQLVLCMGDTLTHLPDTSSVETLISEVAADLQPGGRFVTTFRDYSTALSAEQRFIPVRSDANRILTCFLEYDEQHVTVHDILHERTGSDWKQTVSAYRKLRIPPQYVVSTLEQYGFEVEQDKTASGMIRLIGLRK